MKQCAADIAAWVGSQVLPHEADVRAKLRRARLAPDQIDDIIQESYCRIANLDSVAHIASGRAYLFQTAASIVINRSRREQIVPIESVGEIDVLDVIADEPSAERVVAGRLELQRVQRLIEALPDRCRRIFVLRRIQGVPQKEIARALGVSESTVETQISRGLKHILKGLADEAQGASPLQGIGKDRDRNRARH